MALCCVVLANRGRGLVVACCVGSTMCCVGGTGQKGDWSSESVPVYQTRPVASEAYQQHSCALFGLPATLFCTSFGCLMCSLTTRRPLCACDPLSLQQNELYNLTISLSPLLLSKAFEVLSDAEARAQYDAELDGRPVCSGVGGVGADSSPPPPDLDDALYSRAGGAACDMSCPGCRGAHTVVMLPRCVVPWQRAAKPLSACAP